VIGRLRRRIGGRSCDERRRSGHQRGRLLSRAVVVSRQRSIPCVLAIKGATIQIKNGTMLTVDDSSGTVTVR
jgi:phosphoenolpyruvate-protein kinase (PTS system EI component)